MSTLRTAVQVLSVTAALSCSAATNELEEAILSFPGISPHAFRPDQAVRSANALIRAGKEATCAAFSHITMSERQGGYPSEANREVCLLCRLLFTPKTSGESLRPPYLGLYCGLPRASMRPVNWPYLPFAISNGVPLTITDGYLSLNGSVELAGHYLAYCLSNGVFRTEVFPMPSLSSASNALTDIFASPGWKALNWEPPPGVDVETNPTLREDQKTEFRTLRSRLYPDDPGPNAPPEIREKSRLWQQVKNMEKPMPPPRASGERGFP